MTLFAIQKLKSINRICAMFTVQVKLDNQLFLEFPIKSDFVTNIRHPTSDDFLTFYIYIRESFFH